MYTCTMLLQLNRNTCKYTKKEICTYNAYMYMTSFTESDKYRHML